MLVRSSLFAVSVTFCVMVAPRPAIATFINGDFESGTTSGWMTEILPYGTVGGDQYPAVAPFETLAGQMSPAAVFNVGKTNTAFHSTSSGGGIYQDLQLLPGVYRVTADYASFTNWSTGNDSAGRFGFSVDGGDYISENLGPISQDEVLRGHIDMIVNIETAGNHRFSFLMMREYGSSATSPRQYLDNLQISLLVPEPASISLILCVILWMFDLRYWRRSHHG